MPPKYVKFLLPHTWMKTRDNVLIVYIKTVCLQSNPQDENGRRGTSLLA